jgi:hypothetical protein
VYAVQTLYGYLLYAESRKTKTEGRGEDPIRRLEKHSGSLLIHCLDARTPLPPVISVEGFK